MYLVLSAGFFPMGIGLCYWTPIICGWEWFPENKGLVTGIIVGGFGLGAFIFGLITSAVANPDNLERVEIDGEDYFPKEVADNVPKMYNALQLGWLVLAIICVATV